MAPQHHRQSASGGIAEPVWIELYDRMDGVLRSVVRGYRLSAADIDDVVATTWLRAIERIDQLDDHRAIGGWLVVIARREAMRLLQRAVREVVVDVLPEGPDDGDDPAAIACRTETGAILRGAVRRLPRRQREVVESVLRDPGSSYAGLSATLGIPVGAIGPTRGRALRALRADPRLEALMAG